MKKFILGLLLLFTFLQITPKTNAIESIDFEELFANHQSVMLIIHPVTGDILYANQAAGDFYGYSLQTLLEMNINDINTLTPEEVALERQKAFEEERNFFIFKHKLANGDIRTVYVYSYPVEVSGDNYLYSIIIDQTAFVNAQENNRLLILMGITFLLITIAGTTFLAIKIGKKNKEIMKMNRVLYESEQRFKILHDASFGGLAIHDQGMILDCNQGLSDITGFSMSELINSNGLLLIEPNYRDYVMKKIKSGYEKPYEVYGIRKNGEVYPLKLEARNLPYQGKQVRVVEFRDITEIYKKEKEKYEIHTQWKHLVEEMPLGFNLREMIWDTDGNPIDYRFIDINDAYEDITGLLREDIIGKTAKEVLPDIESSWIANYSEVVKQKKTMVFEDYSRELGQYFEVVAYPFKENQFVVIVEDVTERRLREEELIQKENEKSRIIDNLPGVYYKCKFDDYWTMLYMSEYCEVLTGYKPFELIHNNVISYDDLILPKYKEYLKNSWMKSKNTKSSNIVEYEIKKKDGTKVWIWEKGRAYEQMGEWFIEGFLMDNTERKQYEEKIVYTSKHDFLTGLPNRRFFDEKIKEFNRPEYYPLVIAMIDIDGLKLINDTYGHKEGDLAIKQIANLLIDCCDNQSFISRVGGDEFMIISPNSQLETYEQKRNDLVAKISKIKIKEIQLSFSFGISVKTNQSENIDDVIMNAENNMYANKVIHGQSSRNQVIMTLFNALRDKYEEERNHSDRVSQYCVLMGEQLNLSQLEKLELGFAGRLHDIGKVTIPDHILKKPEKLTKEEWEIMKSHTTNGYQILRSADQYSKLADYALTHHEHFDGNGYPQGLIGEQIPLFSRIIGVCDAYEAMTSNRPYRKAMKVEDAVKELYRCSGTQFDPKLVDIFVNEVIKNEV